MPGKEDFLHSLGEWSDEVILGKILDFQEKLEALDGVVLDPQYLASVIAEGNSLWNLYCGDDHEQYEANRYHLITDSEGQHRITQGYEWNTDPRCEDDEL